MKRFISIFIIMILVGTMFVGCDKKEESDVEHVETVIHENVLVEEIIVEEIITEEIIVEETIIEESIDETVWVSPEYEAELEYNSQTNGF